MALRPVHAARWFALAASAVVLTLAPPAHASRSRGNIESAPPLELWHVDLGMVQMTTSDATFDGSGHYPNGAPGHFSGTGRQIGANHPLALVFTIHPTVMVLPHLALGLSFGAGGASTDGPQDPSAARFGIGPALNYFAVGGDITTVWGFGPFELRLGVGGGMRTLSAPIHAFVPTPCKGGRCYPGAVEAQPYIEPRIAIDIVGGRMFTAGIYAGVQVVPDMGFTGGLFVAIHLPSWDRMSHFAPTPPPEEPPAPPPVPMPRPTPLAPEIPLEGMMSGPVADIPRVVQASGTETSPPVVVPSQTETYDPPVHHITVTVPGATVVVPYESN